MRRLYDPVQCCLVSEEDCTSLIGGQGFVLLRPEGSERWFAHELWLGLTRLLTPAEEALVLAYEFREALLERCAFLAVRGMEPLVEDDVAAAALLQDVARWSLDPVVVTEALSACRDEGHSAAIVLRAFETLGDSITEADLFEGLPVIYLSELAE